MSPSMIKPRRELTDWLIALGLVAVILAVFWQVHSFGLTCYDDPDNISANVRVQNGLSLDNIRWAFTTTYANFRMPLVWISLMIDREVVGFLWSHGWRMGPGNDGVYHLTNVLLHIASTVVLFVVLHRTTGRRWRSAFVAALFAIHPLHVEPVAWATSRKDVLSGLLWMLTMLAYVRYARRPGLGGYAPLVGVFTLALMAKPMVVTLPIALLLMDYWPLARLQTGAYRARIMEKVPLFALTAIASVLAYSAQAHGGAIGDEQVYPLGVRLASVPFSYVAYMRQTLWPTGLIPFYPHPERSLPQWMVVACAVGLVLITVYALRAARNRPYLAVGWLWYVVTFLPMIGIIQVGAHSRADRYTYIPLIGLFVIIAWLGPEAVRRLVPARRGVYASAALACAALGVLAALAFRQTSYWHDDMRLFKYTVRVSPRNAIGYNGIGVALMEQRRPAEAIGYFRKALAIYPTNALFYNNMAVANEDLGRLDAAAANFEMALRVSPSDVEAGLHANYGRVLGKLGDLGDSIYQLRRALEINPECPGANNDLGYALVLTGKTEEAIHYFRTEIRLCPQNQDAHFNLGRACMSLAQAETMKIEHIEEAIREFGAAARIMPDWGPAHLELGNALAARGRRAEAISHYRRAVKLMPKNAAAVNSLAWQLSTSPEPRLRNGREALGLAERACRMTGYSDPSALDTLAAAYAETGRFEDAVGTIGRALRVAKPGTAIARTIRERLEVYRRGRPFREGPDGAAP